MRKVISGTLVILLLALTGCSTPHFLYWPNSQNIPLFKEANTLSGNVGFSTSVLNKCFELQTAYSLPGNIAISAGLMSGGNDHSSSLYDDYSKTNYFEGSVGYYKPFADYFVFELFGGYGGGNERHGFSYSDFSGWSWETYPDGHAKIRYSKFFLQSDIGIKFDWIEAAFSCRFSKLDFSDIQYSGVSHNLLKLTTLQSNNSPVCFEPAITVSAGLRAVKFKLQCVFPRPIGANDLFTNEVFENGRLMLGLQFNIFSKNQKTADK